MGLGKTVQTVSLLAAVFRKTGERDIDEEANKSKRRGLPLLEGEERRRPCLIVFPASVLENWRRELETWGYFVTESLGAAEESRATVRRAGEGRLDVVLASYEKMAMYAAELAGVAWEAVVFDEGHRLNRAAKGEYKAALR